jgi:nucleoside-diphosphate-sugar epimerase
MPILLTGGSGFLGSHIAEQLDEAGAEVRALVRPTSDTRFLSRLGNVTLVEGTMEDRGSLEKAASGVRGIIHAAALVKARSPARFHRVNAEGTRDLLEAAREVAPELTRFVLVSSLAASGPSSDGSPRPVDARPDPVTHYGRSKLAAEEFVREAGYDFPVSIIRPPLIYGPRDREILTLFKAVQFGVLPMTGAPESRLSAVFAEDCAAACIKALHADVPSGSILPVEDGHTETLEELIGHVEVALGRRARIRVPIPGPVLYLAALATEAAGFVTRRPVMLTRDKLNELRAAHWVCDATETRRSLGWDPTVSFEAGAKRTAEWYLREGWL